MEGASLHTFCARIHDRYGLLSKTAAALKVTEHYVRSDVPCQSLRCRDCAHGGGARLSARAAAYFVPCADVLVDFLDVLKAAVAAGAATRGPPDFLVLESVLKQVADLGSRQQEREARRLSGRRNGAGMESDLGC